MKTIKTLVLGLIIAMTASCEKDQLNDYDSVDLKYNGNQKRWTSPKKAGDATCDLPLKFTLRTKEDQMGGFADNAMTVFNGEVWLVAGYNNGVSHPYANNNVWKSNNGRNWISVTSGLFTERTGHSLTSFKDKMWLIGGVDNATNRLSDIWYSSDGVHWILATDTPAFGAISGHSAVVFKEKLFVFDRDQVWSSSDGVSWDLEADNLFTERTYSEMIVFKDNLLIIGGTPDSSTNYNEIWKSPDGNHWSLVTTVATIFSPRSSHTATVYQDKVWVVGGTLDSGYDSDEIWVSSDLKNWCKVPDTSSITRLSRHSSLSFNGSLWIFGGFGSYGVSGAIWSIKEF